MILLKGGSVLTPEGVMRADVLIENERIAAIGPLLASPDHAECIDVSGQMVLPGGVDVHTHLGMTYAGARTVDTFESGTAAAAVGGTTTVIDFAIQSRGERLLDALDARRNECAGQTHVDFGLHLLVQDVGANFADELCLVKAAGVSSIQLTLSDPGGWMLDDASLMRAMLAAAELDITVLVDAENGLASQVLAEKLIAAGKTRPSFHAKAHPALLEAESVQRAIDLAAVAGCRLHVALVTCARSVERIAAAQRAGQRVSADTCIQYLTLDESLTEREDGGKFICYPPLRGGEDRAKLWDAISDGTLSAVISDHCSYNWIGQKDQGEDFTQIPGGLPTIEDRFSLLLQSVFDGRLDWSRFADLVSTAPAKLFDLYPQKGVLKVGSDADITVVDPSGKRVISAALQRMLVDYSCFEGQTAVGTITHVLQRGQFLRRNTVSLSVLGKGRFAQRARGA